METKILLCCLNPSVDPQTIDELSVYEIFKEHAVVKNVKVFSRDVLIKAFVEVDADSVEQAIRKTHMQTFSVGKLKVYESHKENITFDKDLATIISESLQRQTSTSRLHSHHLHGSEAVSHSFKLPRIADLKDESMKSGFRFSNVSRSFENLEEVFDENMYIDYKNIRSVTNIHSKMPDMIKYYPISLENIQNLKSEDHKEPESSKVLIVNRINTSKINCHILMNIFGCFGNVKKVLLNLKASFALVEMEYHDHASIAIKYLNNQPFFGGNIKVKSSKYNTVSLKTVEKDQNPDIQFLRGHYKYFRYKEGLQIKVNKPSAILHVTSLCEKFTSYLLCQLLSQIHEPSKIVKLSKTGTTSDMYLVEFENVDQAMEVLTVLHNKKIEGKLMKISFSHTDVSEIN